MRLLHVPFLLSLWALGCSLSHSPDLPSKDDAGGDGDLTGDGDSVGSGGGVGSGGVVGAGGILTMGNAVGGHTGGVGGAPSEMGQGGEFSDNLGGSR